MSIPCMIGDHFFCHLIIEYLVIAAPSRLPVATVEVLVGEVDGEADAEDYDDRHD